MQVEGVCKAYGRGAGRTEVLREVDLEVAAGELVAVIGPSGSGKSTLLNLVAGLDRPDAGRVRLAGQELGRLSDRERSALRNRLVGFVFQSFHLLDHLTVAENVALPAFFASGRDATVGRDARARDVLARVGLAGYEASSPTALSGGQRQRVAIARALFHEPPLLLADEPTGNLDAATSEEVLDLFDGLHREEGMAVIVVTHEPRVTERAKRTIRLEDGEVLG